MTELKRRPQRTQEAVMYPQEAVMYPQEAVMYPQEAAVDSDASR